MACPLTALANIISTEVDVVNKAYSQKGLQFPSLDDPLPPSPLDVDPSLVEHKALIAAAAAQILATVRSPAEASILDLASGMYWTATCDFVVDTNIPDILKEAGTAGLNVKDIAVKTGVDASYIARVLRFLAMRHIFKEVSPDVFANNRLSSLLTKAKSLEEIRADPVARFDGAPLPALISRAGDEALKSSVSLSSFMQNPGTNAAPFNIALKTEAKVWDWYGEPENKRQAQRFSVVMKEGAEQLFEKAVLIDGVSAASLKKDDVIVDVGGSIGAVTHALYQEMPHYRYVVQDLEKSIVAGKQFWHQVAPDALESGQVKLQVHDLFNPQPVKGAGLYLLRFIWNDWPDEVAKVILKHLRDAADPSSKLIIFDSLAVHTCESSSITTASGNKVPYPLLPCLGVAGAGYATSMDLQMLNLCNGKERTEREFRELGEATGWKLQSVIRTASLPSFLYSACEIGGS